MKEGLAVMAGEGIEIGEDGRDAMEGEEINFPALSPMLSETTFFKTVLKT